MPTASAARSSVLVDTELSRSPPRAPLGPVTGALGLALAAFFALPACGGFREGTDGTWTETGPLRTPRLRQHTATLLDDGRVLVTGGVKDWYKLDVTATETAEIYDPATGTWAETAPLPGDPRAGHSAVRLGNGSVLIVGNGIDARYDPATAQWTPVVGRGGEASCNAVVLADGQVLIASRQEDKPVTQLLEPSVDPGPSQWAEAGPMQVARAGCRLLRLPSGEVMALGGWEVTAGEGSLWPRSVRVEIFSPADRAWREAAPLAHDVGEAVVLPSGDVLAVAITADGTRASRWSPSTGRWQPAPAPLLAHSDGAAPLVAFDLVVRGDDVLALFHTWQRLPPVQRLAGGAGAWTYLSQPPIEFGTMTLLADGRILATGHDFPSSQGPGVPSGNGVRAAVLTP